MGAKIDLTDSSGHTALHLASWFGHVETCKVLIEHHAPLDVKDNAGRTPLHFACQHNRPAIVSLLVEAGADVMIADCNGKTPEQIAAQEDRVSILEYLQNATKDTNKSDSTSGHPPEVEFVEEHNKMKATILKLSDLREEQFEQVNALQNRIEKQQATLSSLEMNTTQLKMKLEVIHSLLHASLKAITDLRLSSTNPQSSGIHFTMTRTPTNTSINNASMQSQINMTNPSLQSPINIGNPGIQSQMQIPNQGVINRPSASQPQPQQQIQNRAQTTTPKPVPQSPLQPSVISKPNVSTMPTIPQVQGTPINSILGNANITSSPLLNAPNRDTSPPVTQLGSVDILTQMTNRSNNKINDPLCNICHKNVATEKCRTCGNLICDACLEEVKHVCPICHPKVVE
ncbi:hypothetical protein TVAG_073660 [Trichomonas vaginalis G3]|uniref:Ankyrin repeat protein n=1 Tax=Trichomonas vaginalis (strain ATCC PRA-98 / G3) TaxID=412133 RepID=A2EEA2_TRIV3|nr:protein ubiquitination [Trichomonas vaginalis G3]EAY09000.1 hypothetical protein TVAG_073660 [Trichomonas vaginalis G3]KAI5496291.1 protein ubiquitination [Trichomonas vaginalis G3]|eukprot:XP_001321223.1 hypothetical protein [Trichomonas vaginalis G3]